MQNHTFAGRRVEHVPPQHLEPGELAGRDGGEVHRESHASESKPHRSRTLRRWVLVSPDHDEVHIAAGPGISARTRAEKKDHRRRKPRDDATHDLTNPLINVFYVHVKPSDQSGSGL